MTRWRQAVELAMTDEEICNLERLAAGEIDRLAVFMPPGSAKSTYSSILFPPWFLAQKPMASVLAASHTTELAEKWGRRVRNLVTEHGSTLRLDLSSDSQAAGRWALTSGAEYYAAGVGVGIAGFRADLAVIDDRVRSREDADSQAIRDRIWDWYKTDLLTRLRPGGRVVLIQTRWHEDDLAGRILAEAATSGEQWHVLSLPAEAEPGDPLDASPAIGSGTTNTVTRAFLPGRRRHSWRGTGARSTSSGLRQRREVTSRRAGVGITSICPNARP